MPYAFQGMTNAFPSYPAHVLFLVAQAGLGHEQPILVHGLHDGAHHRLAVKLEVVVHKADGCRGKDGRGKDLEVGLV